MSAPRIVIAAGGTAGHVVPAIAVADALRAEGAEVSFVGGERAEAELVPAAGYPLDRIRVEGISRTQPARGRCARSARRPARSARRARILRRRGPTRCSAAAATSPGRSGSPPCCGRVPLVLTEADSHLGLTNRLLAPRARRVCLAFPLAGPRRRALPRHRPPGAAARGRPRAAARAALGIGAGRALRARLRRLARRALDQPGGASRRSPTRPTASCTSPAGATSPTSTAPGPALRPARLPRRPSAARSPRPTSRSRAPAARSSSSPSTASRPCSSPIRTRRPTTRPPTRAGWSDGGAAVVVPDAELTPERLRAEVDAILLDAGAARGHGRAPRPRLARPDAARTSRARCSRRARRR